MQEKTNNPIVAFGVIILAIPAFIFALLGHETLAASLGWAALVLGWLGYDDFNTPLTVAVANIIFAKLFDPVAWLVTFDGRLSVYSGALVLALLFSSESSSDIQRMVEDRLNGDIPKNWLSKIKKEVQ